MFLSLSMPVHNNIPRKIEKQIEDEFDIIEDTGDQALISYYNDSPASPEQVAITDKVRQGITNLGFMLTTNGSKRVDLSNPAADNNEGQAMSMSNQIYNSVGATMVSAAAAGGVAPYYQGHVEAYIFC